MSQFVQTAFANLAFLTKAQQLSQQYWQSFNQEGSEQLVTTEAEPKVVIPARVLAIQLFNTLDVTLGEVGSQLVLYEIGKTCGYFSVNPFKEWVTNHQIEGEVLKFGALFFPMVVGLTPRFDFTTVCYQGSKYFVIQVHSSILLEVCFQAGQSTKPALWMVSGWLAGCLSGELGQVYEARVVKLRGERTFRVVVALPEDMGQLNLADPYWVSEFSENQTISVHN